MVRIEDTIWCNNCGVEILWAPLVIGKHDYCCRECYLGLVCECGALEDEDEEHRMKSPALSGMPGLGDFRQGF